MLRCWWVERLSGPVPLQCFRSSVSWRIFLLDVLATVHGVPLNLQLFSCRCLLLSSLPSELTSCILELYFFGVCRLKIVLFYHELTLWSINNVLIKMFDWKFLLSDISLVMPMLLIAICMAYLFFSLLLFSFYVCVSYKMPLVNSISLDNFFPTCHPLLVGDLNPFVQCYWWRSPYLCHFAFIFSTSSRFCLPQFLHYRFFGLIDFSSAPSNSIPISCPVYSLVTFLVVTMGIK